MINIFPRCLFYRKTWKQLNFCVSQCVLSLWEIPEKNNFRQANYILAHRCKGFGVSWWGGCDGLIGTCLQGTHPSDMTTKNMPIRNTPIRHMTIRSVTIRNVTFRNMTTRSMPIRSMATRNMPTRNMSIRKQRQCKSSLDFPCFSLYSNQASRLQLGAAQIQDVFTSVNPLWRLAHKCSLLCTYQHDQGRNQDQPPSIFL